MRQEPLDVLEQLESLAEELNDAFEDTHYAALGERMSTYIVDLQRILSYMYKPASSAARFFDMQKRLLKTMRETQALIRLSMDQSRPMSANQVRLYLDIKPSYLDKLESKYDFPAPYWLGNRRVYRKHEIDTWLFRRPDGHRKPMPKAGQQSTAVERSDTLANVVRMVPAKNKDQRET